MFLPFRIGGNPDSTEFTEFTRPLSGSVRLINRHCPGTVTSATNALLSLVSSYILPQTALLQDDKSDVLCICQTNFVCVLYKSVHFLSNFTGFLNSDPDTSCFLVCTTVELLKLNDKQCLKPDPEVHNYI